MQPAVTRCCQAIAEDLNMPTRLNATAALDMAAANGGAPILDPALPPQIGALHDDGIIRVSTRLRPQAVARAVVHELVHRLSHEPRWEHLNHTLDAGNCDRTTFIEQVASETARRVAASFSGIAGPS